MDILFKTIAFMEKLRVFLSNKKTYLVCAGAIITAAIAWANGAIDTTMFIKYIFEALAGMTVRAAITKSGPAV